MAPYHHLLPTSSSSTSRLFLSLKHKHRNRAHSMSFSSSSSTSNSTTTQQESQEQSQLQLIQVLRYHNQTKHSFSNYAKSPSNLDWANQPDPFRRFNPTQLIPLQKIEHEEEEKDESPLYSSLFLSPLTPKPVSILTISELFYDSLSLSAWKSIGSAKWSLRVNPSSGNLHPTEAYIVSPPIGSVSEAAFVAHYAPKVHALEIRVSDFAPNLEILKLGFLIGFSSVFWRESWKYGERAFRYCNHDVGHAIGAVSVAAAALGWDVKILDGLGFKDLENLMGLGFDKSKSAIPEMEFEHPDCVLAVFPNGVSELDVNYEKLSLEISKFSNLDWNGKPNLLSKEHVCWDIIYKTAETIKKPLTNGNKIPIDSFRSSKLISEGLYKDYTVREVVRKRRSAVDMDGVHVMEKETFYQILLHCLPSGCCPNGEKQGKAMALGFRALSWDAQVHAVLFIHRVKGLPKGLYFLVRNEEHFDELKKELRSDLKWVKPEGCPDDLPLYELARGDCQIISKRVSCHQDIAGDGCFSLGMVARFEPTLRDMNAWMYPRLFWETGVLGQILYLEAHAIGISATGIGCYFDDAVHEILGLTGANYQSLYHFTVGWPVLDKRIMSLPAYHGPAV